MTSSYRNTRNLLIFTTVNSIGGFVMGLIGPFFVVYVEQFSGGMEKFGIAFSIMVFLQSISTYFSGHYSDKFGRKPFLIVTSYAGAIVMLLYTVISNFSHLYILQGLLGITSGIYTTTRTSLLGDLTSREGRGSAIGRFEGIESFASAAGLALSGYVVAFYGIKYLFYLVAIVNALSSTLLFFITENPSAKRNP